MGKALKHKFKHLGWGKSTFAAKIHLLWLLNSGSKGEKRSDLLLEKKESRTVGCKS